VLQVQIICKFSNERTCKRNKDVQGLSCGFEVYKKTLKNVFLYVFSNGQIQVGKKNFDQIVVSKSKSTDENIGIIREKEGVY